MQWEYRIYHTEPDQEEPTTSEWLNKLGGDRWELVNVSDYHQYCVQTYIFKRPLKSKE